MNTSTTAPTLSIARTNNTSSSATTDNNEQILKNALEVRNLNFYYGKFHGLKNINMNVAEHKVTAFIEPLVAENLHCCEHLTGCTAYTQVSVLKVKSIFTVRIFLTPSKTSICSEHASEWSFKNPHHSR